MTPKQFCDATNACKEGRDWALTQPTMADVWDNCPRADWLLWIADRLGQRPDDRTLRSFAIWCARNTPLADGRKTGDLLTDPRSLAALEVAEKFAHGRATTKELAAASSAASSAAWDAASSAAWDATWDAAGDATSAAAWAAAWNAAGDAAWDAASSAAWDAASSAAWDATWDAAWDAASSAAWDAAWAAAWAAAWDAACDAQSAYFRTLTPNPFRKEAQP